MSVSRSYFYDVVEPWLERVQLGPKAIGYSGSSVNKLIVEGIPKHAKGRRVRPSAKAAQAKGTADA